MSKPKNKPLHCTVTRDGVLRIEIGIETLAHAFMYSSYAYDLAGFREGFAGRPEERLSITSARGFAVDVKRELMSEREDGSSLLTDVLDAAERRAIEDGSEHLSIKGES